jgi:hypothetical protein
MNRHASNRFVNCIQDLICEAALAALKTYSSLLLKEAKNFATKFVSSRGKLAA